MFRLLFVTPYRWPEHPPPYFALSEESGATWAGRRPVALLFLPEKGPCNLRVGVLPARRWLALPLLGRQVGFLWVCSMLLLVLH